MGTDQYPTTLDQAYRILSDTQHRLNRERLRRGETIFQRDRTSITIPEGDDVILRHGRRVYNVECNNCDAWGHYASACPKVDSKDSQKKENRNDNYDYLSSLCYILDTGSTHNTLKDLDDVIKLTHLFQNGVSNM